MQFMVALSGLILSVFATIAMGYAFATTWGWFIAPVFGLPFLTMKQGVGIMLQAGWLFYSVALTVELARKKYDYLDEQAGGSMRPFMSSLLRLIAVPFGLGIDYLYYLYL